MSTAHRHGDVPVAGEYDDRQRLATFVETPLNLQPVRSRHLDIQQDARAEADIRRLEEVNSGFELGRSIARRLQERAQRRAHCIVVVDQEYQFARHLI